MPAGRTQYRYIILGAGCAGLSLCLALLRRGVTDPILLLDSKTEFADDRTWCFWEARPNPFSHLAEHCWHRWQVWDDAGRHAEQSSRRVGYRRLRGRDFYDFALAQTGTSRNVTLRLAEGAVDYTEDGVGVEVRTTTGATYHGEYLFDGVTAPPPDAGRGVSLRQRFLGQTLRTDRPCFDPRRATLMDFRADQTLGPHFFYVLPTSSTEALVENTYLQPDCAAAPTPDRLRREIAQYVRDVLGACEYAVVAEEAGAIPMTTRRFPLRQGRRIFRVGTPAGAVRPSSGYAFLRIQTHSAALAEALAAGRPQDAPRRIGRRRSDFFDVVFLAALRAAPGQVAGNFQRLFARVPPETLARFLTETSTWADDLAVVSALPKGTFARAALRSLPLWLPHLR